MLARRSFDASAISSLAHSPDAIQWLCAGRELDWPTILSAADSNVLVHDILTGSHALFQYRAPRLWEGHIACPQIVRGKDAIDAGKRLLEWFDGNIGQGLFAKSFAENRRVRMFMPRIGFRFVEERDGQAFYERIALTG